MILEFKCVQKFSYGTRPLVVVARAQGLAILGSIPSFSNWSIPNLIQGLLAARPPITRYGLQIASRLD